MLLFTQKLYCSIKSHLHRFLKQQDAKGPVILQDLSQASLQLSSTKMLIRQSPKHLKPLLMGEYKDLIFLVEPQSIDLTDFQDQFMKGKSSQSLDRFIKEELEEVVAQLQQEKSRSSQMQESCYKVMLENRRLAAQLRQMKDRKWEEDKLKQQNSRVRDELAYQKSKHDEDMTILKDSLTKQQTQHHHQLQTLQSLLQSTIKDHQQKLLQKDHDTTTHFQHLHLQHQQAIQSLTYKLQSTCSVEKEEMKKQFERCYKEIQEKLRKLGAEYQGEKERLERRLADCNAGMEKERQQMKAQYEKQYTQIQKKLVFLNQHLQSSLKQHNIQKEQLTQQYNINLQQQSQQYNINLQHLNSQLSSKDSQLQSISVSIQQIRAQTISQKQQLQTTIQKQSLEIEQLKESLWESNARLRMFREEMMEIRKEVVEGESCGVRCLEGEFGVLKGEIYKVQHQKEAEIAYLRRELEGLAYENQQLKRAQWQQKMPQIQRLQAEIQQIKAKLQAQTKRSAKVGKIQGETRQQLNQRHQTSSHHSSQISHPSLQISHSSHKQGSIIKQQPQL